MTIKSLADLKRAIKLPGLIIKVCEHWQPNLIGTTRTPKAVRNSGKSGIQTNGYYFDGVGHEGKLVEMWAMIPPASQLRFNDGGSVTFYPNTERSWTLAFGVEA
jgi:hypothetical protein